MQRSRIDNKKPVEEINDQYVRKVKRDEGYSDVVAEVTTVEREEAEKDPRSAFAHAALCAALIPLCDPSMVMNVDATQFNVGSTTNGKARAIKSKNKPRKQYKIHPSTLSNRSRLAYTIKYYLLIDAAGTRGPAVNIGNSFRGSKGQLKMQSDAKVASDPTMAVLDQVFKDHIGKYYTTEKTKTKAGKESIRTKHMSAEHIKAAKIGLLKIQRAVPSAIRRDIVVLSANAECIQLMPT